MNGVLPKMEELDYISKNRQSWNNRVDVHVQSAFYDNERFLQGKSSLNAIELGLLGYVAGKTILHLQCHFGQDSISLARMGASVTAVDLSDRAIEKGRLFAEQIGVAVDFICCDIYDLAGHLDRQFDIVFTSYGTIGWLPDLDKWGALVSRFLKPGGKFVFVEFHPVVWMFDDDFDRIAYPYSSSEAFVETQSGTYAERDAPIESQYVCWNHGLGKVLQALVGAGLELISFEEFDYSPYNCFKHAIEYEPGKFRIEHIGNKMPMVYALKALQKNKP